METKKINMLTLITIAVIQLISVSCERNLNGSQSQEEDLARAKELRNEIIALSESVPCNNPQEWKFIAMGAKACGGPMEYVFYSTKIDTSKFKEKVERYTAETKALNKKWDLASDCRFIMPPSGIKCANGKPVPMPAYDVKAVVGKWKLTETLADPGDGSGKYTPVTGPAKYVIFDANGNVTGEANPTVTGYKIINDEQIELKTVQNTKIIYRYKIAGNQLELNPPCIEPCGAKFVRM